GIDALTKYNREVKSIEVPDGKHTYKKRVMDEDTK
ncbi:3-methyl-2-oxobutanoate hydroxymethyltransferase, partial [Mammaliicoccus sciuri]